MPADREFGSDVSIADVRSRLSGETDGERIRRLIAVWEFIDGRSPAAIEATYRYPDGTVERWLERVEAGGLDALLADASDADRPTGSAGDRRRLAQTEDKLRSLQETTRELMGATTADGIAGVALEACVTILGMPISVFWRYDDERDALVPEKQTEYGHAVMGTLPSKPFARGEGVVWRAVESGEVRYWEDLWDLGEELYDPDTDLRSEIDVPLGDHGALGMGSMSPSEFDVVDVDMCRILGRAVESALDRAERERQLERKTERLTATAEVVSHDLQTPLDVGSTRVGMLEEALAEAGLESEARDVVDGHLAAIEGSLERATEIARELLTITREEPAPAEAGQLDVRTVAADVWETVETDDLALSFRGSRTVSADEGRLRHLLENCIRNVVEHAAAETVQIGATPTGFFVEDDGRGIPPDERERVLERGYTTAADGRGLGLAIVAEIADECGWALEIAEGDAGGARIEVDTEGGGRRNL